MELIIISNNFNKKLDIKIINAQCKNKFENHNCTTNLSYIIYWILPIYNFQILSMKRTLKSLFLLSFVALFFVLSTSQGIRNNVVIALTASDPLNFEKISSSATPSDSASKVSQQLANQADSQQKFAQRKVDTYNLATTVFNSQYYLGALCDRCKKLQYFAFRFGGNYVTARPTQITFQASSSPNSNQLFIGYQQVDGTWAFQSLTEGKYIRAGNDGATINYQTYVGPWERWYMQRHGSHSHIQSGQFENCYWIVSGGVLQQFCGGASSFIVQHWPKINWGWNW